MTTDQIRAIYNEALNAETESARLMAWNAGDNAGATCSENGQEAWDAGGNHTDDFMFWWMQSVVSILSDDNNAEAHAYYAQRGITA